MFRPKLVGTTIFRASLLALALAACDADPGGPGSGSDAGNGGLADSTANGATSGEVIQSVADLVALQSAEFAARADLLSSAAAAHASAPTEATRAAAQEAWTSAISSWQALELMQFGPAARMADSPGGEGLRDEIYSWPIDNPCRIDQVLVAEGYAEADFAQSPPNVRGLDALEYLLFGGADNACSESSAINTEGSWDALSEQEIAQRRARFALVTAELVLAQANTLAERWDPEEGTFYAALTSAGEGSALFATRRDALNLISNALFYLDKETKDMKLALPSGLSGCAQATCPDTLESVYAGVSGDHIAANVMAFSALYHGGPADGPAIGFHELLIEAGAEALAAEMAAAIAAAVELVSADMAPMHERLNSDLESVIAAYDAVKAVTDLLKTQFVGVLDLELPQRAAGDND